MTLLPREIVLVCLTGFAEVNFPCYINMDTEKKKQRKRPWQRGNYMQQGCFAAHGKTANPEAPVDKEFRLSSRAYLAPFFPTTPEK